MRKKFLHVALIVVSMAVFCCVSAFAADKPYGYPEGLPMVPDEVSDNYYLIIGSGSSYTAWYSDNSEVFAYEPGTLYCFPTDGTLLAWYTLSDGVWGNRQVYGKVLPDWVAFTTGDLAFSDFDVKDRSGNIVYTVPVPPPPDPYKNFWGDLDSVSTSVLSYVGDVCETIVNEPVLLITMGILLLGGSVGIFRRLLSRG